MNTRLLSRRTDADRYASTRVGYSIEKHPDMISCTDRHFPPIITSAR